MFKIIESSLRRAGRVMADAAPAVLLAVLASCATAPPPEMQRLVWPAPPQTPRVEFQRSLFSDADIGRDATFNEKMVEFLAGKKPPANRIAEPLGLAASDDGNRLYVSDYAQLAVFIFDFEKKTFTTVSKVVVSKVFNCFNPRSRIRPIVPVCQVSSHTRGSACWSPKCR